MIPLQSTTILLIIDIAYGVCRIVIKSVQQCTYFLFFVNLLLVGVNYGQRTMQVQDAVNKRQNTIIRFYLSLVRYDKGAMADKKQFSNTKSIVKVETGIVTLISYRHYLKISYDQICKKKVEIFI